MEIWTNSAWNPARYEVSDCGNVRNKKTGRILHPGHTKDGYLQVVLYKDGKKKTYRLHRLVWESFNGSIPEGYEVNHINEDKTDNRLCNLNLMTRTQNVNWGTKIERTSQNLRGIHINRKDQSVPVAQYSLEGEFIASYPSTMEAERQNPSLFHTAISACCKGKVKTHGGFIWRYAS